MKKVTLIIAILFASNCFSQKVKNIGTYICDREDESKAYYFKVKKHLISLDTLRQLFIDDKLVFREPKDSSYILEVYDNKFLMVSFYPASDNYLSFGLQYRYKHRLTILSIKNPKKKWLFYFNPGVSSNEINTFDETNGELYYKKKIKGNLIQ